MLPRLRPHRVYVNVFFMVYHVYKFWVLAQKYVHTWVAFLPPSKIFMAVGRTRKSSKRDHLVSPNMKIKSASMKVRAGP